LLDTNLFISYLLKPQSTSLGVVDILRLAVRGNLDLVVLDRTLIELRETVSRKPDLRDHIPQSALDRLVSTLEHARLQAPSVPGPYASVVRDRNDDYLMAHAKALDVDVLISGDKDLLELREQFDRPRIVTVRAFLDELHTLQ